MLSRRRASRRRIVATTVATVVVLRSACILLSTIVATLLSVCGGRASVVVGHIVALVAIVGLLSVLVVGIVLRLATHGNPAGAVEWLATGLASTACGYASAIVLVLPF
jgi:hypothetical protein